MEIGCGTGDNAIWLAQQHFQVTGTDAAEAAIDKAKEKAAGAGVECDFKVLDFFKVDIDGAPFGFIFDRGCFHSFSSDDERSLFARRVALHLEDNGLWLTLAGNADEHRKAPGPPQRSAAEIVRAVEPYFMILSLTSSHFGSNHPKPPRAWRCVMQKRTVDMDDRLDISNHYLFSFYHCAPESLFYLRISPVNVDIGLLQGHQADLDGGVDLR